MRRVHVHDRAFRLQALRARRVSLRTERSDVQQPTLVRIMPNRWSITLVLSVTVFVCRSANRKGAQNVGKNEGLRRGKDWEEGVA